MRFSALFVLPAALLLTACPPTPGPRFIATLPQPVDSACIERTVLATPGVNWIEARAYPEGSSIHWIYGFGTSVEAYDGAGPNAKLYLQQSPEYAYVKHDHANQRYMTKEDYALTQAVVQNVIENLNRECGLPSSSDHSDRWPYPR